ncbi:MAG: helicase HerA domain-containing protein [Promethearchaeota archaeon]
MVLKFWHARVRLTQAPAQQQQETILDQKRSTPVKIQKSWLRNYFHDNTVYGLELTSLGDKIIWEFFLTTPTQKQARIKQNLLLKCLKKEFPGLSGETFEVPIEEEDIIGGDILLYEIVFPVFTSQVKTSLIKEFIQNNRENPNKKYILKLFILWQEDDSITNTIQTTPYLPDFGEFKIKVFVGIEFYENPNVYTELEKVILQAELKYLTINIVNLKQERATLEKAGPDTWKRILAGKVFWINTDKITTGIRLTHIEYMIPKDDIPSFITPPNIDFHFPKYSGLPKPFLLQNENIIDLTISEKNDNYIWFGKQYRHGVLTQHNAYFHINDLSLSCIIAGKTGSGKTSCASIIIDEINTKAPNIGVLIINLKKKNQEIFFGSDKIYRFGKDHINIPYFIMPNSHLLISAKHADETADYLTASIGLKGVVKTGLYNTIMSYKETNNLPKTPIHLFEATLDYFDNPLNQYNEKFHTNITTGIRESVTERLTSPVLEKILKLNSGCPKWFQDWRYGENIFLDLTDASIWEKRIITFALLQMIKTLTEHLEENQLHNLIMIDDASQILALSTSNNPRSDEFIAKDKMEYVFKELLEEFRSRGVAFLLINNEPSSLFKCVSKSPSLKIVFRLDLECGKRFTLDPKELNYLKNQENRNALFFNGATGEEFIIKTLNRKTP